MEISICFFSVLDSVKELAKSPLFQNIAGNLVSAIFIYKMLNKPIQKTIEKRAKQKYLAALAAELLINFSLAGYLNSITGKSKVKKNMALLDEAVFSYQYQTVALKEAIFRENFGMDFHLKLTMLLYLLEALNKQSDSGRIGQEKHNEKFALRINKKTAVLRDAIKVVFTEVINPNIKLLKLNMAPVLDQTFADIDSLGEENAKIAPWFKNTVEDMKKTKVVEKSG